MDKLNFKLSKFFYEHKSMFKKADMGYFESVLSPEDIKTISPMLNEMMELPKYKPTIDKLKTSLGVVNFVTKDGYAPLIEFLLKTAFPLNYNDVFNIEESEITGDSFSIGANFFGTVMDAKGTAIPKATKKLEDLLLGSDALMTRDWLKEQKGMTDGTIDSIYGKFKGGLIQEWLMNKAEAEKEALTGGMMPGQFPPPDEVKNSPAPAAEIGWQMAVYEYQVKAINDKWGPEIQRLENELSGLQLPAQQENQEKALPSKEHTRTIKESIKALISARQETLLRLKQEFYPALGPATINKMKGTPSKNKDGFVNYNPAKSLIDTSRELIRYMSLYNPAQPKATIPIREGDKIQGKPVGALAQAKILELRNLLAQYRSTDPNYTKIMDEFLKLMGQGNPDDLARIKANLRGTTARLQKILTDRVMKHGKVLILDELDKTVMCHQAQKGVVEMDKSVRHLLSQFISINNTNREKDNAPKGKKEYGNRIVVAISTEPIGNLPSGSTVIELDTSPVNAEEAAIIVKYCVDEIDRDKNAYLKYKKFEDLEAKENSKETKIKLTPKEMESLVPDYIRRKVSAYISGLNVRDAITAVRTTLQYAINKNEEDVLRPKISIDADRLLKTLRDDVNKRIQTDVLGVKIGHADVKFDEYAYNKYSQWATQVEGVGAVKMALSGLSALIKSDKLRLAEIDDILEKNADNHGALKQSDKDYYVAEREVLISRITYNEQQRASMAANDIPHIYLLWGKPGVGKSVWAHALADLFDLSIVEVDITAQFDKWVGSTGKNARSLLNMMGNSKATVFLIDEIDRQVQSGSQKNKVQQDAHETTKQVVYHFLQFFEDTANNRLFKANEIFFIMTSNNEDCIDKAWLQRTGTGFYEVKLPEDPEDYEKFFKSYMNVERARFPDSPWLQDPEEVARLSKELANLDDKERTKIIREKGWETTFRIINTQLDWRKIAAEFSGKRIDFRTLKMILQQAYSFNGMWNNSMSRISGTTDASVALKEIRGLPLTTENILQSAKFAETSEVENSRFNLGITDVAMRKRKKIDQMAAKYANKPLATSPHLDPFAQKLLETPGLSEQRKQEILKRYQTQKTALPQEIIDFMQKGEVSVEAEPDIPLPEYDYEEDVDPKTGLVKGVKPKSLTPKQPQVPPSKTPQQEAQELMQESFEETEEGMPEQNKQEDEDVKVKSSTDYYYNFLRKNGILDKDGKIQVSKLNEVKQLKEARQNKLVPSRQNQAKKGELFYDGAVMIVEAPQ